MKTFEKNLSRAVEQMVPEDGFDRIMQTLPSAKERRTEMTNVTKLETAKRSSKQALRWISGIAAAVLLIASGAFGGFYYASNVAVDSVVSIDVNPSFETLGYADVLPLYYYGALGKIVSAAGTAEGTYTHTITLGDVLPSLTI